MSVKLATELQITPTTTTQVALSSFGADSQSFQTMDVVTVPTLSLSLLALTITGPLYKIVFLEELAQSKLGYLLSGPVPHLATQLSTLIFLQLRL